MGGPFRKHRLTAVDSGIFRRKAKLALEDLGSLTKLGIMRWLGRWLSAMSHAVLLANLPDLTAGRRVGYTPAAATSDNEYGPQATETLEERYNADDPWSLRLES